MRALRCGVQLRPGVAQARRGEARRAASLELEGAVQGGRTGARTLDAWFWIAEGQWQWRALRGVPTLSLGVEAASGDRPATATRQESFAVLYPAAHQHGGFADVIGRPNVRELHLIGGWDPVAALTLRGAWYRFDRRALDDGVYTKQNSVFRAASGSTARHAADELDLTAAWKATAHLRVLVGGATVLPETKAYLCIIIIPDKSGTQIITVQ